MSQYASQTTVSSDRSLEEIRRTLRRYGADQFIFGEQAEKGMIMFRVEGRQVKFIVPMPQPNSDDIVRTNTGRKRMASVQKTEWEKATRQRWRALALAIKAKLEVVESGISTFDQEFLGHILLPDGKTVGDHIIPNVTKIYATGKMPRAVLPAFTGGGNE